eukprot:1627124-Amphidinium_carterae.1
MTDARTSTFAWGAHPHKRCKPRQFHLKYSACDCAPDKNTCHNCNLKLQCTSTSRAQGTTHSMHDCRATPSDSAGGVSRATSTKSLL